MTIVRSRYAARLYVAVLTLAVSCVSLPAVGASGYYDLTPQQVAPDTYVFFGKRENFSFDNHGNIVNTSFIVTDDGVVVIDTGPSRLYGEAMRAAIGKVTDRPIAQVYITHAHPDHFLGNNAYDNVPIAALPGTVKAIRRIGSDLASNLYALVGAAMRGTSSVTPTQTIDAPQTIDFGCHHLRLIGAKGHTDSDLMVFDETTGVLFTGDLVFNQRAPTTPNADPAAWHDVLGRIDAIDFKTLVPGHGPVAHDDGPVAQTKAYLSWLTGRFQKAAARGESEAEVLVDPLPPRWAKLAVEPGEYRRSVSHLYPDIEKQSLPERSR